MWLILGGLLIFIDLAVWWLFRPWNEPWWVAAIIAGVIGFTVSAIFLTRFIRSRSAAAKLEKALAAQGAQQAMNARPERRAEIQELQKQLQGGINALKTSKLGRGGKSGASALYTMPWYMIVGPPGAGKTTALKHSGLVFPYSSGSGGGVRGVGGTRNCDWWFTNEAILLDTAGRYTTEQDDRDEWLSFLQFLLKYRNKRPINGILVAISITDLIDANEQQIEVTGKRLRARIDEVMTQLHMVVPVYVLFTKVDLIAGFNEFYGDLRKSDRAQAWGATFKLDVPKNEPGKLFDAEFDTLLKHLHQRSLKRMATERSREARERIFGFPLEFAGLKRNLSELIAYTFAVNAFQGTPIFRGFYFTSGTQEGRPLDRVLGRMGQAMGIRTEGQQQQAVVESKSYFLHDVFMNIVFPDGDLAARSAGEVRRQWLMRVAISASAFALACILAIPAVTSAIKNHDLILDTEARAKKASKLDWESDTASNDKVPLMKPLLERLQEIDKYRKDGVPISMGWWMYSGETLYKPALHVYLDLMTKGFVNKVKDKLEEQLKHVDSNAETYNKSKNALKMYLMLTDADAGHPHLDVDWATGKFSRYWVDTLKEKSGIGVSEGELRDLVKPHVNYYFSLLKISTIAPADRDTRLVEEVRTKLQQVAVDDRYYAEIVGYLADEKYDESGDDSIENLVFPPISLNQLFIDRPLSRKLILSKNKIANKAYYEVGGPYTAKAYNVVVVSIDKAKEFFEHEAWVVPPTPDEEGERIPEHLAKLAERYQFNYVKAWNDFFDDIQVKSPTTIDEALELWGELKTSDYPYRRLLVKLRDNTQFKIANPFEGRDNLTTQLNQSLQNTVSNITGGITVNIDVRKINKAESTIPNKFRNAVSFGDAPGETDVYHFTETLTRLINTVAKIKREDATADIRAIDQQLFDAKKEALALLQTYDQDAQHMLRPLIEAPLTAAQHQDVLPPTTPPPPGQGPPPTNNPNNKWNLPQLPGIQRPH